MLLPRGVKFILMINFLLESQTKIHLLLTNSYDIITQKKKNIYLIERPTRAFPRDRVNNKKRVRQLSLYYYFLQIKSFFFKKIIFKNIYEIKYNFFKNKLYLKQKKFVYLHDKII